MPVSAPWSSIIPIALISRRPTRLRPASRCSTGSSPIRSQSARPRPISRCQIRTATRSRSPRCVGKMSCSCSIQAMKRRSARSNCASFAIAGRTFSRRTRSQWCESAECRRYAKFRTITSFRFHRSSIRARNGRGLSHQGLIVKWTVYLIGSDGARKCEARQTDPAEVLAAAGQAKSLMRPAGAVSARLTRIRRIWPRHHAPRLSAPFRCTAGVKPDLLPEGRRWL